MALKPLRRFALRNGDLPCDLLLYDVP